MIVPIEDGEELVGLTLEVNYFTVSEEKAKRDTAVFAKSHKHLRCDPRDPPVRAIIWETVAELRKTLSNSWEMFSIVSFSKMEH